MHKALSTFLDNKISLELPLKYPEVYCVTYTPEFPGPLVSTIAVLFSIVSSIFTFHAFQTIEIRPSTTSELRNTTEKPSLISPSGMLVPTPLIFIYLLWMQDILARSRMKKLSCSLDRTASVQACLVSSVLLCPEVSNLFRIHSRKV